MLKGKAPEILRSEAYLDVRANKPAPCLTRGRMRATPQMGFFQQPAKKVNSSPSVSKGGIWPAAERLPSYRRTISAGLRESIPTPTYRILQGRPCQDQPSNPPNSSSRSRTGQRCPEFQQDSEWAPGFLKRW